MRSSGRLRLCVGAALLVAVVLVAATAGVVFAAQLTLFAAPFLAITGLLLGGHYIGEERILATRRAPAVPKRRNARDWPCHRVLPLSSALERAPWSLRGPPAVRFCA